jgi:hypothetical protein
MVVVWGVAAISASEAAQLGCSVSSVRSGKVLREAGTDTHEPSREQLTSESRADIPQRETRRARDRELDDLIKQQDEKQKEKEEQKPQKRGLDRKG